MRATALAKAAALAASAAPSARRSPPRLRRNAARLQQALAQVPIAARLDQLVTSLSDLRVLGLDINTSSTGFTVLLPHGRVCRWGHISTAGCRSSDVLEIARAIASQLETVHRELMEPAPPLRWQVGIEDFMRMYRAGRFHTRGIFQLAQLNGIVSYACWQQFDAMPIHTHPTAARRFLGIDTQGRTSAKTKPAPRRASTVKEQVLQLVLQREAEGSGNDGDIQSLPRKANGQYADAAYDMADSYVIAAFTRWSLLQSRLQQDADLARQFGAAYLDLLQEAPSSVAKIKSKSKKPTVEETAVGAMDAAAKAEYLQELYRDAVAAWVAQTAAGDIDIDASGR